MPDVFNCLIMGAAGRDFHDFQTFFRDRSQWRVCAFTATQIPFIEQRVFPKSLAGKNYDADIPIFAEEKLPDLIQQFQIDFVFLAYSDLSHEEVMHKASLVQACGASFVLLGPRHTQLPSKKPVIAVTAVRTGAGKSPLSQWLAQQLKENGYRPGIIRHPMPYGDLNRQAVERLATIDDLKQFDCTVEEEEEFLPYIERGFVIYAGVDYQRILEQAGSEADVILWDGGNNDFSFLRPNISIVVVDALRPGHETAYYPGETNFRAADVLVINKVNEASKSDVALIRRNIEQCNPGALVIESVLEIDVEHSDGIAGRRVLVIEDGPTLTHGGMAYGAGTIAAKRFGALEIIDPRPYAIGSIAEAYRKYPHMHNVLPALGYSPEQCEELRRTIQASGADIVIDASPAKLERRIEVDVEVVAVRYRFRQTGGPPLFDWIFKRLTA